MACLHLHAEPDLAQQPPMASPGTEEVSPRVQRGGEGGQRGVAGTRCRCRSAHNTPWAPPRGRACPLLLLLLLLLALLLLVLLLLLLLVLLPAWVLLLPAGVLMLQASPPRPWLRLGPPPPAPVVQAAAPGAHPGPPRAACPPAWPLVEQALAQHQRPEPP